MGQIPLSYLVTAHHGKSIPCDSRKGEQSRIFTHRNELKWLTWGSHWPNQTLRKGSVDLKPFCLLVSNSEFHSLLKLVICRTQSTFHLNISKQSQSPVTYDLFIPRLAKEYISRALGIFSFNLTPLLHLWSEWPASLFEFTFTIIRNILFWVPDPLSSSSVQVECFVFSRLVISGGGTLSVLLSLTSRWKHFWPCDTSSFPVLEKNTGFQEKLRSRVPRPTVRHNILFVYGTSFQIKRSVNILKYPRKEQLVEFPFNSCDHPLILLISSHTFIKQCKRS